MIDRIEFNILQSADFITAANADTKKAVKFQQEARRVSVLDKTISKMSFVSHHCHLNVQYLFIIHFDVYNNVH
jgi:hypothetical protein